MNKKNNAVTVAASEEKLPENAVDYRKLGGTDIKWDAEVVKCGIAPAALKKITVGEDESSDVAKWCVVVYLKNQGRATAADYVYKGKNGDVSLVEYTGVWTKQDYAIHYAGKLADKLCGGRVTKLVEDRLAEADVRVRNAKEKAERTRKWNESHADEHTAEQLAKKAKASVKNAKSTVLKEYADGVRKQCEDYLTVLRSAPIKALGETDLGKALAFLASQQDAQAAAVANAS